MSSLVCFQKRCKQAEASAKTANEGSAQLRTHLYKLVADMASAPAQTSVQALRASNIVFKTYESKAVAASAAATDAADTDVRATKQHPQQQQKGGGGYMGGLFSAPRHASLAHSVSRLR